MSQELDHVKARHGCFVLHDNGSVFYGPRKPEKTILVSRLDEDNEREFSFPLGMSASESEQGRAFAVKVDAKRAKGIDVTGRTVGEFIVAANGEIYWGDVEAPKVHHVSWIDDECKRVVTDGSITGLLSEQDKLDLAELIARYDAPIGVTNQQKTGVKLTDLHVGDKHLKAGE
jgi:hypothetical protein